MSEYSTGKITLPIFDHEEEKISLWWMRFKARGIVKGFSQGLNGVKEASLHPNADDSLNLSKESRKKAQK